MAIISCPECNGKVSDKANTCPHCGNPLLHNAIFLEPVFDNYFSLHRGPDILANESLRKIAFIASYCLDPQGELIDYEKIKSLHRRLCLMEDGTVYASDGPNKIRKIDWSDIVSVFDTGDYFVGLTSSGRVLTERLHSSILNYYSNYFDVDTWQDIAFITGAKDVIVGITFQGTIRIFCGNNRLNRKEDIEKLTGIVRVEVCLNTITSHIQLLALRSNGTVFCNFKDLSSWSNVKKITSGDKHFAALKCDGTVLAVGDNSKGQRRVSSWNNIKDIACDETTTYGLKNDGHVVCTNIWNNAVETWSNIETLLSHPVAGLTKDGFYLCANGYPKPFTINWRDLNIVSFGKDTDIIWGPKESGTTFVRSHHRGRKGGFRDCSNNNEVRCWPGLLIIENGKVLKHSQSEDVILQKNLVDSYSNVLALCSDGTILVDEAWLESYPYVAEWTDAVSLSSGYHTVAAITKNRRVHITNPYHDNEEWIKRSSDVNSWSDISKVCIGHSHVVGLKTDGTVVAAGVYDKKGTNVHNWSDVVDIATGSSFTLGLCSNGDILSDGLNEADKETISTWKDIIKIYVENSLIVAVSRDNHFFVLTENNRYIKWNEGFVRHLLG